jgi:hypothetical protein
MGKRLNEMARWVVAGCSEIGTSHAASGIPCQDFCEYRTLGDERHQVLVVVMADGAGSAAHAEAGSKLACQFLLDGILAASAERDTFPDESRLRQIFKDAHEGIERHAVSVGTAAREFAATALTAIVANEAAIFAQIGDGAIVFRQAGLLEIAFWPEPNEYINETVFLTDPDHSRVLQVRTVAGRIDALGVLTDGLQRLALDFTSRSPSPGFFEPLFRWIESTNVDETPSGQLKSFLGSDRVNQRTDDDKSLVCAALVETHEPTDEPR